MTCLATGPDPTAGAPLLPGAAAPALLFAGSWDRTIHSFSLATGRRHLSFARGHSDFVKCLAHVAPAPGLALLLSGGADRAVVVWDVAHASPLLTLTGHAAMLQSLAVDPLAPEDDGDGHGDAAFALFSAASDGAVIRWVVRRGAAAASTVASSPPAPALPLLAAEQRPPRALRPHPATVYALAFLPTDAADLVTASADGTAAALARDSGFTEAATQFTHGGHVRCVAAGWGPDAKGGAGRAAIVVTGGRDEDVCVWDAGTGGRRARFRGHFDEVLGVACLPPGAGAAGKGRVVSAGLDGTVRCWALDELGEALAAEDQARDGDGGDVMSGGAMMMEQGEATVMGAAAGHELARDRVTDGRMSAGDLTTIITADEQMELDAMMDDDDDPLG